MTHILTDENQRLLNSRWKIEHINAEIKRFRGLRTKYTKTVN